jgi:rare lipoprotein A
MGAPEKKPAERRRSQRRTSESADTQPKRRRAQRRSDDDAKVSLPSEGSQPPRRRSRRGSNDNVKDFAAKDSAAKDLAVKGSAQRGHLMDASGKICVQHRPSQRRSDDNGEISRQSEIVLTHPANASITQQNHQTAASFPRSNARELIKKLEAAVAAFPSDPLRQQPPKASGRAKPGRLVNRIMWLRKKLGHFVLLLFCCSLLSAAPPQNVSKENSLDRIQAGQWVIASMYWQDKLTATGKAFKPVGLYAAHKTLPMGTLIRVSNPKNHRSINITVNDRGPYVAGRDLDLTLGAGALLGFEGLGPLYMEVLALPGADAVKRPVVENLFDGSETRRIEAELPVKPAPKIADAETTGKADKAEKADKADKADKAEKAAKPAKAGKAGKAGKSAKSAKAEKPAKRQKVAADGPGCKKGASC